MTTVTDADKEATRWANSLPREDFNKVLLLLNKRGETTERETVAKIVAWLRTDPDAAYKPADAIEAGEWK